MKTISIICTIGVVSIGAALSVACGDASSGVGASGVTATALASAEDDGGAVDNGADAGYFACQIDSDCVAVKYFDRCCYNGWKIAVARAEVEAYESASVCPREEPVCPLYIADDTRVATCQTGTCGMVALPADDAGEADGAVTPAL